MLVCLLQDLLQTFTLPTGVCLFGLTLHSDGQPDLRTRRNAENLFRERLGGEYIGYKSNLETLEVRGEKLCQSFGKNVC